MATRKREGGGATEEPAVVADETAAGDGGRREAGSPYQVLARRLRPQAFEDIIGQEHVTRTLRSAIESGRVAHAFLFAGPRGVGKTTTARVLAKALNCERGPTPQPCNACASCREIADSSAIDVLELDGASNRGIDDAREIVENVRYRPAKSRYKLYIIDEVHQLTKEAFNALLKTLEEPPPHVKFIFATTEPDRVLPTIVSRCQRYDFRRLSAAEIRDHLQTTVAREGIQISPEGLFLLAREADGSVRDSQSLLEQVMSFAGTTVSDQDLREMLGLADRRVLHEMTDAIVERKPARCLELADELYRYGYDVRRLCRDLLEHFRNVTVAKLFTDERLLADVPPGEIERVRAQAARLGADDVQRIFKLLLEADEEIGHSSHPKLVLEMVVVRLAMLEPLLPIDDIVEKLEALEARIGGGSPAAGGGGIERAAGQGRPAAGRGGTAQGAPPAPRPEPRTRAAAPGSATTSGRAADEVAFEAPPPDDVWDAPPDDWRANEAAVPGSAVPPAKSASPGARRAVPTTAKTAGAPAPRISAGADADLDAADSAGVEADATGARSDARSAGAAFGDAGPASAATAPASAGTVPWRDFLALVQQERKALYMTLVGSRCLDLGAQELTIGVESEVYARELSKKENRGEIEALAARAFGRPLAVSVQAVKAARPGAEVAAAAAARETEESFKRETLEHPAVKAALDILGGEVRAVKRRRQDPRASE
jgi:DNA polymerase-3 subunit gamma/tau